MFHRRAGKSKTALNQQIAKSQIHKGVYYYFLPTYKQAKQVIWDQLIKDHLPREIVDKVNESELAIYYKNGSIQRFAGCEDINKHRGINPIDVVFDEYSEMREQIWTEIIQPVLRENNGTASFIFTPKGQNHAWKLIQTTRENPNWYCSIKSVKDTNAIPETELEEAKRNTPEALYKQEYLCEFLESAGAFFKRVDQNLWDGKGDVKKGEPFQLGVDLAKYQDWTVLTPFSLHTFKAHQQDRFNQVDWNLQKAKVEAAARRLNDAKVVVDSTGVGDPIAEDLERTGLEIESFKFTEINRKQLLDNLAILLEQDKIKIPNDEGLISELKSMTYRLVTTATGKSKLSVQVPEGMTDDRIMSLALAVWEVNEPVSLERHHVVVEDYKPLFESIGA